MGGRVYLIALAAIVSCQIASATIINVPGQFATIQAGIESSNTGDTVLLAEGTYYENVIIDHTISMFGLNRDNTIIRGNDTSTVIMIAANNVHISDLSAINGGGYLSTVGIRLDNADSCRIENCFTNGNSYGILLIGSSYSTVTRCLCLGNNNAGILLGESPNPAYTNMQNQITNNVLSENNFGIYFAHMLGHHYENRIDGNKIVNNTVGLYSIMFDTNEITRNEFSGNSGPAITIEVCMGGGDGNMIHHNNFLFNSGNSFQVSDMAGDAGGRNYWYSPSNSEGNYWSDYNGPDADSNGIGDTAYVSGGAIDSFPVMTRFFGSVEGQVFDIDSVPLDGVCVLAQEISRSDTTGPDGTFHLDSLGSGNSDIIFSKSGYQTYTQYSFPLTIQVDTVLNAILIPASGLDDQPALPVFTIFNYPNPFNPTTTIRYNLPKSSHVSLEIYDILGRKVETLVNENQPAGPHQAVWNARNSSSGIYFYRLQAGEMLETKRMILLR